MSRCLISAAVALLALAATPTVAEVKSAAPGGFAVGGYTSGGLEAWAAPVDGVLSAQLTSLKAHAEAGD